MSAYYNEIDPFAAAWLRELIKKNLIVQGEVDERSIEDVRPEDLKGFIQCHFFAGIGVWSHALRQAGWPDDRPVWTGSCPCQPFSSAGKGKGFKDERHLWPEFYRLISQCRPTVCFGEQVASKDGLAWVELVQDNMEGAGYAFGAVDTCSAGFGAPHIRQRLYWVSHTICPGLSGHGGLIEESLSKGREREKRYCPQNCGESAGVKQKTNGFWRDADWLFYSDRKWRPVEPEPQQMVDGSADFVGHLRSESIHQIEEKIDEWAQRYQTDPGEALRNLWEAFSAEALQERSAGRRWGLFEAPVLLAFLRQLTAQGWKFKDALTCSGAEISRSILRRLRFDGESARASHGRELAQQQPGQPANPLRELSQIVAHNAEIAWGEACRIYAGKGFPLASGSPARMGRLRGYGNAINAEQAKAFIEAYMETI